MGTGVSPKRITTGILSSSFPYACSSFALHLTKLRFPSRFAKPSNASCQFIESVKASFPFFSALSFCAGLLKDSTVYKTLTSSLRKEVIQPHLPIRLPCYDFTPVIGPTFGSSLLAVGSLTSGVTDSHGVTGGVYKTRERIHRGILIRDY